MNRTSTHPRIARIGRHLLVALAGFGCTLPALAGVSLPNTPLQSGSTVPPNITVLIDDSGSMHWRYIYIHNSAGAKPTIALPSGVDGQSARTSKGSGDETGNDNFGNCVACTVTGDAASSNTGYNDSKYMVDKSYVTNGLYYNPKVAYTPWKYPDGTSAPNASYISSSRDHQFATYNFTSVGGATIAEKLAVWFQNIPYIGPYSESVSLGLVVLTITVLTIWLGELVPKRLGINSPERIAQIVAGPMLFISRIFSPLIKLMSGATNFVLQLFGVNPSEDPK